jgi:hypothetical protein
MASIKKQNTNKNLFSGKQGKIKYWVDIRSDEIEIKIYSSEPTGSDSEEVADSIITWDIIKLSELNKKPGFVDQTLWSKLTTQQLLNIDDEGVYSALELTDVQIVDVFGETLISKPAGLMNASSTYWDSFYNIFIPDADDFSSAIVRIIWDSSYTTGYEVIGPSSSLFVNEVATIQDLVSPITMSSDQTTIAADGSITVNIETDTFIDEVYLEQVYGILNKTRVKLTNGIGSFVLYATGLEAGETARVKAGHRKYTGIANFTVPVV